MLNQRIVSPPYWGAPASFSESVLATANANLMFQRVWVTPCLLSRPQFPLPESRQRKENDMTTEMRYSILQIKDGPWIVVDRLDHRCRIASCIDSGAAKMIAALMNGDVEHATAYRDEAIAELDRPA